MTSALPVTIADIEAAAARLAGQALITPLVTSTALDERVGAHVLLKLETLQRCGSFKFRGAFNKLAALTPEARQHGVVAWSSGNHAQGVAAAAHIHGVPALIVMPADTPRVKVAATEGYGAEIRFYDRWKESREEIGHAIAAERGAVIIPPYDDPLVIAGQGTVGLELAAQAAALGEPIDHVLAPASGGGLVAGIATAMADRSPATQIWCVEPAAFDDHRRSLAAGRRVANDSAARSLCDALLAATPGEITFAINRERLSGGLAVGDGEALDAVAYALRTLKLVVEPGGAVALAALLTGKLDIAGKTVAVILSGGNIDPPVLAQALERRV
jgi:threonine dehydratase